MGKLFCISLHSQNKSYISLLLSVVVSAVPMFEVALLVVPVIHLVPLIPVVDVVPTFSVVSLVPVILLYVFKSS